MSDHDRERETVRDTERTTVVQTDGGRGGGGGVIVAVVLLLVVAAVLFVVFGGAFNRAADEVGVNVNVEAPKVEVPDVDIKVPEKIEVKVPEVEVKSEGNSAR
ncbi:MAG TPA: hypothetical protein VEA61_04540 [Allosphingosinicella sp.]|nr:hypothetical protein [Allosphingosinicella sp.]